MALGGDGSTSEHYLRRELTQRARGDAMLAFLLESAHDAVSIADLEREPNEWRSDGFWRLLGHDPTTKRHVTDEVDATIHPDDRAAAAARRRRRAADGRQDETVRHLHHDGSTIQIHSRGLALRDARGQPTRWFAVHSDVTTTRNATRLDRWQRIFRDAGWGIAISNRGRQLDEMNPEFARMHGYTIAELTGRAVEDVFSPAAREGLATELALVAKNGRHTFESEHVRKDGSTFPELVDATAIFDADGALDHRVVNVQDVTARKRQEAELETATLSRGVLDRLLEGCQVIGFDFRYLYANDLVVEQARRPRDELIGRTMMECYPGIDQTPMFAKLRKSMNDRTLEQMENSFSFPDGSKIVFDLRFIPVPQGVCILSLDITERRHELAAIVNDSHDAIVGRTIEGTITNWNRSAERLFGWTATEIVGRPITDLIPEERREEEKGLIARLIAGESLPPFETSRLRKDGSKVPVSIVKSLVRSSTGAVTGISTIARDVSELRAIYRELDEARRAAEAANKELESFSYSVAHDLRAPLRSIDGFSQAVIEDWSHRLDDDARRQLGIIRQSAQLMAKLIDDMLGLARMTRTELKKERVDVSAIARDAAARLANADATRTVEVVIAPGLEATGDPRLLAIVFANLLGNAWKFTSKRARARIEVGARRDGGVTVFYVKDDGAGFDMAHVGKLFGVFQRLHSIKEYEGTGVGLATVKRVVERHGGTVWAEAAPGAGATFHFTLEPEPR